MPYASLSDMITRYGEKELINLTDRSSPRLNAVDAAILVQAFFDADAEIDGYLAVRYTLPLPHTPPVLMRIACDITRYRLYDKAATEEVRNRYTDAVKWLAAIARGLVSLGMPTASAPTATGPLIAGARRAFSRDALKEC
jgi:phage gp36-like protein